MSTSADYPVSAAYEARAKRVTPNGSQTLSKRPDAFPSAYPKYFTHGDGPHIFDVDGHQYLDWIGALGATPLGVNHPRIAEAVDRQRRKGSLLSLTTDIEVHVAEQLVELIPCAEQVRFTKTGSEACAAAVRIARSFTGRDHILVARNGYHGWHDTFAVLSTVHPGVPDALLGLVGRFTYNDLRDLSQLCDEAAEWGEPYAAVILEPARLDQPDEGFLAGVVDVAHRHGALAIFDEMILGARYAIAGGQEYFDVTPDLATFGKAFGAGYPLAFIAGRAEVMTHAWPISGTYSGEALPLAACEATLRLYRDEPVIAHLWTNGELLRSAFDSFSDMVTVRGQPPHMALRFSDDHERHRISMSVFMQQCAQRSVLFHSGVINASAAMTTAHLQNTCDVVYDVLTTMRHTDHRELLIGQPYADSVRT